MKNITKLMLIMGVSAVTLFNTGGGNAGTVAADSLYQQVGTTSTGFSFDKGTTRLNLGNKTTTISVANRDGTIEFKQGDVKDIEVHMKVEVNHATKQEAKVVASKTKLQVKEGKTLDIGVYSASYGKGKIFSPSVHLTITLPRKVNSDLHAEIKNGNISLSKVTGTGKIKLGSQNGNIIAKEIGNDISLHTIDGIVYVSDAKKSVNATVTNGDIEANRISGALHMETMNGDLTSKDALSSIKATTISGFITIKSSKVGGDWDVSSTEGDVALAWPEKAGVQVNGTTSFGEIETNFPLTILNSSVTGKIGSGSYHIRASSEAGLLSLMKN